MIKEYIKYFRKDIICINLVCIGIICFILCFCYVVPTCETYHDYGFTYFFSIIIILIIIFGNIYQYKEFKRIYVKCKEEIQEEKDFYSHMVFDNFVDLVYDNEILNLNMIGCPNKLTKEQEKEWLKRYLQKLINNG